MILQIPTKSVSVKSLRSQGISPKEEEFIGFLCHTSSGTWFLWSYKLQRPALNYFSDSPKPAQVNYGHQQEHEPGFKHFEVITVGTENYLLPFLCTSPLKDISPHSALSWFIELDLNSKETDAALKKQKLIQTKNTLHSCKATAEVLNVKTDIRLTVRKQD